MQASQKCSCVIYWNWVCLHVQVSCVRVVCTPKCMQVGLVPHEGSRWSPACFLIIDTKARPSLRIEFKAQGNLFVDYESCQHQGMTSRCDAFGTNKVLIMSGGYLCLPKIVISSICVLKVRMSLTSPFIVATLCKISRCRWQRET